MRVKTVCGVCGSSEINYLGNDMCYCTECKRDTPSRDVWVMTPYERTRAAVYATGNKWAIENFNATH